MLEFTINASNISKSAKHSHLINSVKIQTQEASSSTASHGRLKLDFFFHKAKNSIFNHVQVASRERDSASCLVWHIRVSAVCMGRQSRGEGWKRKRRRRRVGCRRRKFVFVQRATQQQHSCDADFNNINLQTHRCEANA